MATTEASRTTTATTSTPFHDLDELLLGSTDLEAMPFEFGCDFASAFEDTHLQVDAPGPNHRMTSALPTPRPKEVKRSHKRKSDAVTSSSTTQRPLPLLASPSVVETDQDDVASTDGQTNGSTQIGRWTKKEHELFLEGLRLYGKSWKKISSLVVTRTLVQIRTHAQKYLQKQTKSAMKAAASAAAAAAGTTSTSPSKSRKVQVVDSDVTWKHSNSNSQHATVFLPIAFPGHVAPSSSSISSSSFTTGSSSLSIHKDLGPHSTTSMSKIDQLLHDDSHSDMYTSPMGTDDDLVQWLQHRHLPYATMTSSPLIKRRRTEQNSSSHGEWAMVNPMEVMAGVSHASYFSNHTHHGVSDFLPPLSAYSSNSATATSHTNDNDFFGNSWL